VAGIGWLSFPLNGILGKLLQPIHVVERNTMNVTGRECSSVAATEFPQQHHPLPAGRFCFGLLLRPRGG